MTSAAAPEVPRAQATVRRAVTVVAVVAALATLYFGRGILVPLALALLVSFALEPLVARLERWRIGRAWSVAIVMGALIIVLTCVGWVVITQLKGVVDELPRHRAAITSKMEVLSGHLKAVEEASRQLVPTPEATEPPKSAPAGPAPGTAPELPLYVTPADPGPTLLRQLPGVLASLLNPIGTAGIVMLFAVFMLLHREDLRNRCIRLISNGDLTVTTQALTESSRRVGRYLAMQATINGTFGLAIAIGLMLIGVPGWALWGFLCALLRFVPYVGIMFAAAMPAAMALAASPGWELFFATIGLFIAVELIVNLALEPRFYGASAGISPFAVLVGAAVWTWLWGPIGLVLAMPLTVVIVVMGKNVPQLGFLHVLLGTDEVLSPSDRYYQRIMANDPVESIRILEELAAERPLAEVYETLLVPALAAAEQDRAAGKLTQDQYASVCDNIRDSLEEMETRHPMEPAVEGAGTPAPELVCQPVTSGANDVAAAVLCRVMQRSGHPCRTASADLTISEQVDQVTADETLCLLSLSDPTLRQLRAMCQRVRSRRPEVKTIVMAWGATLDPSLWRSRALADCSNAVATNAAELVVATAHVRQQEPARTTAGRRTAEQLAS